MLSNNIDEFTGKTKEGSAYFVWGTIGGLYPGWAWGVLLCADGSTANFIGIANSENKIAAAHFSNGTWVKITGA